ncbi:MAG TPA: universal stress protein [Bacteroidales bacterium]|nr:universal stress protein [Bacteroidales bacterium]
MNEADNLSASSAPVQKIKRILVPVDYSECSTFACQYAIKIACKVGAEIRFFHTYYSPAFDLIELAGAAQTQSQLREEVTSNLEETEKETILSFIKSMKNYITDNSMPQVNFGYDIAPGVPEDEIIRFSETYDPHLVIMGTRGKGTGMGSIIGSVTAAVINRIRFPTLAIPEKYTFVGEKNVKNLLYVTDFDESDFQTLKILINLTEQLDLSIHCVHIGEDPKSWDRVKMEGLMEYFKKAYGKSQVTYSFVSEKNLLEDLDNLVRTKNINIVSLTSHRQNVFEKLFRPNITKKLFYHTSVPLLVFH